MILENTLTKEIFLSNDNGVLVSVNKPNGRVYLKTNKSFPATIECTFRNIDEVEYIFNKTVDTINCNDLLKLSHHPFRI